MRKINDLSDAEKNRCAMDMAEIQCDVTEEIVRLADKHGISRDEAMKHFINAMAIMAEHISFENYEISEEEPNENRG